MVPLSGRDPGECADGAAITQPFHARENRVGLISLPGVAGFRVAVDLE